ncbi:alginate O-acetyltransferase AlgX-related protein [Brachyspira aalborgi]|uniref:AlgX/AlgJ SGNH hydrolase-like domain-containing protein n=2 Tax=Brachyspira aalborgi TaxID=29522 RepID=A0A5C8EWD4_9SPIR|nr:hypothetical protein [Brachyspira aalborgi]TXJ41384.1 hypothetical protein EPJ81_01050 [Brachyspira aalborgi]
MRKIIYLCLSFLLLATLITFHILGSKERVGYLSDFEIIEKSKNNYIYDFRIRYYDKVFRNSDIYGVYLITNSLPEYIKEIKMKELGSPFGIIISDKIIEEEKIDNIKYILRLKIILVFILLAIVLYSLVFFEFTRIDLFNLLKLFIRKLKLINIKNKFGVILILFLCFLIMPNIIYRIFYKNFDHTNYENRTLASKPIFMSTNINEYPKKYEEYFNDYLPFRNELVKLKNLNDIFVFNNLVHKDLILGKEKWLFLKWDSLIPNYMGTYTYTTEELERAKNNLIRLKEVFNQNGADFYMVICPDKNQIYPEYMPDYIKRIHPEFNATDVFIKYMKENTDLNIIYLKEYFLDVKKYYPIYYKFDAHWNKLGAYFGYQEIMNNIGKDYININNIFLQRIDNAENTPSLAQLASLRNSKLYKYDTEYIISNYTKYKYKLLTNYRWEYISCESDSKDNTSIVMIRDSFADNIFDYMSTRFSKTSYIIANGDSYSISNIIKTNPNIVIYLSVERYFKHRILYEYMTLFNR